MVSRLHHVLRNNRQRAIPINTYQCFVYSEPQKSELRLHQNALDFFSLSVFRAIFPIQFDSVICIRFVVKMNQSFLRQNAHINIINHTKCHVFCLKPTIQLNVNIIKFLLWPTNQLKPFGNCGKYNDGFEARLLRWFGKRWFKYWTFSKWTHH